MAKFLVVHPNLDIYGGGEKVCHHVLKALSTHSQEVQLLTFDFDSKSYFEIMGEKLPQGVTVHELGERTEIKPPFTIYKKRRKVIKLLKKFKNVDYDFVFSTQSYTAFEAGVLNKGKRNIAYVHFPEIHYTFDHSGFKMKTYLWLYKKWLEKNVNKLDMVFCNSNYTKAIIEKYWKKPGIANPITVYPPVNLTPFWCSNPLKERTKRVVYLGRFIPQKRHGFLKKLAVEFPKYEFVSIGGLRNSEEKWFEQYNRDLPKNYSVKPNLPGPELIETLQDSQIYCHLMEGEHFGIAPIEALASGCVTLVHSRGGSGEFIPEEFRWNTFENLKEKIAHTIKKLDKNENWETERNNLWAKIKVLEPENFENEIFSNIKNML
ncbi:MAG: glycosyltransferase family 4 protein [Candidatus Bathyarchaeia archaeon]